jgi:hypothetical protein
LKSSSGVSHSERSISPGPLLSIVLTRPYDGGDSSAALERGLAPLRFNHEQLAARGIAHEFVIVEWAPPSGQAPFEHVLTAAIPTLADDRLVSILVDPRYDEALRPSAQSGALQSIAKNVGIRRARGVFVLSTDWDVCFGRGVLRRLADRSLEPGVLYRALRVDLQVGPTHAELGWEALEEPRNVGRRPQMLEPPLYLDGAGDFILLDRHTFHRLRGFNEVYRVQHDGEDDALVVKAAGAGCPIQSLGAPVYHIQPAPEGARPSDGRHDHVTVGMPPQRSRSVTYNNGESWGLSAAPERALGPHRVWLEFDWRAVPPLVDLKGVVLPPLRLLSTIAKT